MNEKLIAEILKNNNTIFNKFAENLYYLIIENSDSSINNQLTKQDCIDYIYNLTINRTYDGYIREKTVVEDNLTKEFPEVRFEESEPELDHAGDIDFLGFVGDYAFGLQIKPVTSQSNFGNYSPSDRMKASFREFSERFKGKVFIIYSISEKIQNLEVIEEIKNEIQRLKNLN